MLSLLGKARRRSLQLGQSGARFAVGLALLLVVGFAAYLVWLQFAAAGVALKPHPHA